MRSLHPMRLMPAAARIKAAYLVVNVLHSTREMHINVPLAHRTVSCARLELLQSSVQIAAYIVKVQVWEFGAQLGLVWGVNKHQAAES